MKYTESKMIEFALHYAMALIDARTDNIPMPSASNELEVWKTKTGRK